MEDLNGLAAVVTGGGSGIGRGTSRSLSRAGVSVLVADIDGDRAATVAAEVVSEGGRALGVRCDVSSDDDVQRLREVALEEFGRVDIVMNNVGVLVMGRPENVPVEAWRRVLDINVLSVARSIAVFLPAMLEQGSGHFVNTASTAGLFAYSYERLPYSASKGAVIAVSEALALYCRPRGIGVTVLCPGPVSTNIGEQMQVFGEMGPIHSPGSLKPLDPSVVGDQVVDAIRRNVFLLPTHPEIHDTLVQRAQDPEGFIVGQIASIEEQDAAWAEAHPGAGQ
jgi:NAD(P)-dependent dehydrogenase (short-subunit alcohol dehydrogenase family)